ncbi:hypothetical protein LXA43DRAFT_508615 [Ganoderma leucocontextum]|nr:hypothetical protein LXA43DRAFT_508615 [Ganoderma leucocontextum]
MKHSLRIEEGRLDMGRKDYGSFECKGRGTQRSYAAPRLIRFIRCHLCEPSDDLASQGILRPSWYVSLDVLFYPRSSFAPCLSPILPLCSLRLPWNSNVTGSASRFSTLSPTLARRFSHVSASVSMDLTYWIKIMWNVENGLQCRRRPRPAAAWWSMRLITVRRDPTVTSHCDHQLRWRSEVLVIGDRPPDWEEHLCPPSTPWNTRPSSSMWCFFGA